MSRVIPLMQTINDGVSTRVGDAVRLENGEIFILGIDRDLANGFIQHWFDHVATFNPQG